MPNLSRYLRAAAGVGITDADKQEVLATSDALRAQAPGSAGILFHISKRALSTGSVSADPAGITTAVGDYIDSIKAATRAAQVGVQFVDGFKGDLLFPVNELDIPSQWVDEAHGTNLTQGSGGFGSRKLTKKTLTAQITISRQLLADSHLDVESIVINEVARNHALSVDTAVFAGSGTGAQPLGILNTAGIGTVDFDGGLPTYGKIIDLGKKLHRNYPASSAPYLITTPEVAAILMATTAFNASTGPIWAGTFDEGLVAGVKATTSSTLPVVGDTNPLILGDFSNVVVGLGGAMEIIVDPFTKASNQQIVFTFNLYAGVLVKRPAAFVAGTNLDIPAA
jgi:HK97 family phage major capsid protein